MYNLIWSCPSGGILCEPLAELGLEVTGIDLSEESLAAAREHAALSNLTNVHYKFSTVEDHSVERGGYYDVVVASEVIEHVTEKDEFLKACVRWGFICGNTFWI